MEDKVMLKKRKPVLLSVAGPSGSGKTTLADELVNHLREERSLHVLHLKMDNWYKCLRDMHGFLRKFVNYDRPDALKIPVFYDAVKAMMDGREFTVPTYCFETHTVIKETAYDPCNYDIIVIEGIMLHTKENIRDLFDIRIYVELRQTVCFRRRYDRDQKERGRSRISIILQYLTVLFGYMRYVRPYREFATVMVSGNGNIKASVRQCLEHIIPSLAA